MPLKVLSKMYLIIKFVNLGNNKNNAGQSIVENSKQASGSGNGDVPSANAGQNAGGNQQTVETVENTGTGTN